MLKNFVLLVLLLSAESSLAAESIRFDDSLSLELQLDLGQTLDYINNMSLSRSTPLYQRYFGDSLNGRDLLPLLRNIQEIRYEISEDLLSLSYVAHGSRTLVLTQHYPTTASNVGWNQPRAASILFHELWHMTHDSQPHRHVQCPREDFLGDVLKSFNGEAELEGKRGCDSSLDSAYAVEAVFLYNLGSFCETCSDSEKSQALRAADLLSRRIVERREVFDQIREDIRL